MDLPSAYRYMRLCAGRPVPSKPLRHARLLLTNTLPPVRIDDAAAAAHDAAAHSVTLAHLPAELLDEESGRPLCDVIVELQKLSRQEQTQRNSAKLPPPESQAAAAA